MNNTRIYMLIKSSAVNCKRRFNFTTKPNITEMMCKFKTLSSISIKETALDSIQTHFQKLLLLKITRQILFANSTCFLSPVSYLITWKNAISFRCCCFLLQRKLRLSLRAHFDQLSSVNTDKSTTED